MKRVYLIIPLLLTAVVISSQVLPLKSTQRSELVTPPMPPEPPLPPLPPPQPYDKISMKANVGPTIDEIVNADAPAVPAPDVQPPPPPPPPPVPEYEDNFQQK